MGRNAACYRAVGWGGRYEYPVRKLKLFKGKVQSLGISYMVIAEQRGTASGLKRRVVTEKLIFMEG